MRKFTYAITGTQFGLDVVNITSGRLPSEAVWPVHEKFKAMNKGHLKIVNGSIEEKTQEEKDAFDTVAENWEQSSKPAALKTVENNFLLVCDMLTQSSLHEKLGFDELHVILEAWPDPQQKLDITVSLLAIDAEAKREGGLNWWDSCAWHEDIV